MRFAAIYLKPYGPFSDRTLEFRSDDGDLQVIYGPNEAGKSSIRQAIADFLFGFPQRTTANFLHDAQDLRVGAKLEAADGHRAVLFRRKGTTRTVLRPDGVPADDNALRPFSGTLQRETFERIYALDHERLARGADDLRDPNAGIVLFEAGAGIAGVGEALEALEEEASQLFRQRGHTQPVNVSRKALSDLRATINQATLTPTAWKEASEALDAAIRDRRAALEEHRTASQDLNRLHRIRRNLGPLSRRRASLQILAASRDVPRLPDDARVKRLAAEAALERVQTRIADLDAELKRRQERRDALILKPDLVARAADIRALSRRAAETRRAAQDIVSKRAQAATECAALMDTLRRAGIDASPERAIELLPAAPVIASTRALITEETQVSAALSECKRDLEAVEEEIKEYEESLRVGAGQTDARDLDLLSNAVVATSGLTALEIQHGAVLADIAALDERIAQILRALSWTADAEALAAMALPSSEEIEAAKQAVAANTSEIATAKADLQTAKERLANAEADFQKLGAEETPSEGQLRERRANRDQLWELLRRLCLANPDTFAREVAALDPHGGPVKIAHAFTGAIHQADALADLLRVDADRVGQLQQATAELGRAQKLVELKRKTLARVETERETILVGWRALWPGNMSPGTPEAMIGWMRRREDALELSVRRKELIQTRDGLAERIAAAVGQLVERLRALGVEVSSAGLSETLALAKETLAKWQAAAEARAQVERDLQQAKRRRQSLERRHDQACQNAESWRASWNEVCARLPGAAGLGSEAVQALLDLYVQIEREHSAWRATQRRVDGMERDREGFDADAVRLQQEIGGDSTGLDTTRMIEAREAALNQAEHAQSEAERLDADLRADAERRETLVNEGADAKAVLAGLCAVAGNVELGALPGLEDQAARRDEAEEAVRTAEAELQAQSDGLSIAELEAEAEGVQPDALAAKIAELESRLTHLNEEATARGARENEARRRLEEISGPEMAAEAAQAYQAEKARFLGIASAWIRLSVASRMLKHAIERYRDRNQAPIILRAGELFIELTDGAYNRLVVDHETGEISAGRGTSLVAVSRLSDGTRDSLYLALRLAAVEQFVEGGERIPFIADDLLLNFDDNRVRAAFRVLHKFSRQTQVLFFTHHAHMLALAREALGPALMAQDLGRPFYATA